MNNCKINFYDEKSRGYIVCEITDIHATIEKLKTQGFTIEERVVELESTDCINDIKNILAHVKINKIADYTGLHPQTIYNLFKGNLDHGMNTRTYNKLRDCANYYGGLISK